MTLCEHGCGTELTDTSHFYGKRGEVPSDTIHTDARCQAATRALLDEARREVQALFTQEAASTADPSLAGQIRFIGEYLLGYRDSFKAARQRTAEAERDAKIHASRASERLELAEAAEKRAVEAGRERDIAMQTVALEHRVAEYANARAERSYRRGIEDAAKECESRAWLNAPRVAELHRWAALAHAAPEAGKTEKDDRTLCEHGCGTEHVGPGAGLVDKVESLTRCRDAMRAQLDALRLEYEGIVSDTHDGIMSGEWFHRCKAAERRAEEAERNAFDAAQRAHAARDAVDRSLAVLAARSASDLNITEARDRAYATAERELLRMQKLHLLTIDAIANGDIAADAHFHRCKAAEKRAEEAERDSETARTMLGHAVIRAEQFRAALEFYASPRSYKPHIESGPISDAEGGIARAALAQDAPVGATAEGKTEKDNS